MVRSKISLRGGASRRDYWQAVLVRQAESGLSIKAFCTRARISYQSYFLWQRKFRDEPVGLQGEVTFSPVTVVAQAGSGAIEIVLSQDRRVLVHGPVDRQVLADVLAVLSTVEAEPC